MIQNLSLKYNKPFTWKFPATSHSKGVVDGVGGKVKSTIPHKVISQTKNCLIVQDAESFASTAKKLISSTKTIHNGEPEIVTYKDGNPFESVIEVKGISKMHVKEVDGDKTSLWKTCALKANSQPVDIILNNGENIETVEGLHVYVQDTGNQMTFQPIPFDVVNIGMWVIPIYEDEKWLANVVDKRGNQVLVRCLEKPFGIKEPQTLEREQDAYFVEQVFHTDVV